ncbi:hypothetical protein [Gluconacetobacter sp.]|uniref:hypothetical protein n=1 Tax=Gluconacetobacter sp. TaxID=1935994 RepID=UPI0039E7EFAF
MKTVFFRILDAEDKAEALRAAIVNPNSARDKQIFELDPVVFSVVPRSPFAYWVGDKLRGLFAELPPLESEERTAKAGLNTNNDKRFLRAWWEISVEPSAPLERWVPLAKGGSPNSHYTDTVVVVRWFSNGAELKAFASAYRASHGWGDQWSAMINAIEFYFRPGFTWPLRASRFAPAALPAGSIFSKRGCGGFAPPVELPWIIAFLSSRGFDTVFKMLLGRFGHPEFSGGGLQRMPMPEPSEDDRRILADLFRRSWSLKYRADTRTETSHAFVLPQLLQVDGCNLASRISASTEQLAQIHNEILALQSEIDQRSFEIYGLSEGDQRALAEGFGVESPELESSSGEIDQDDEDEGEKLETTPAEGSGMGLVEALVSWAVGVAFGRFDVRIAAGLRKGPPEPAPFDPLPPASPGMLIVDASLQPGHPGVDYPLNFPENGMLVDDPGHSLDLTRAVRSVFEIAFQSLAEEMWNDASSLLDAKGRNIQKWLSESYFGYHLRKYSKGGRKAPVVWQLGVPSRRYSVWLYAHRLTRDSLFQIQNELVTPKLAHEERQLAGFIEAAGPNPNARQRKEISEHEGFVTEISTFLEEIKRVAPLWKPELDDGVVITMSPLWRLVPHHKVWQKELKSKWEELASGKYDWAHLAMHLWPERVVPKCAIDRSIAIAHGLADVFWTEGADGKWRPRQIPTRPIDEIVRERTSVAVKAALLDLVTASAANGSKAKARRSSS